MKALVLVLAVGVAVLAGATRAPARAACTESTYTYKGVTFHRYCGPAHAALEFQGQTLRFTSGRCRIHQGHFTIFIGTLAKAYTDLSHKFFGAGFHAPSDGRYTNVDIAWQYPHGYYGSIAKASVRLSGGRTHGRFAGHASSSNLGDDGYATGTFNCS